MAFKSNEERVGWMSTEKKLVELSNFNVAVKEQAFEMIIENQFVDDMPLPSRCYGVEKYEEDIVKFLKEMNLFQCSENTIYLWNAQSSRYVVTLRFRDTSRF